MTVIINGTDNAVGNPAIQGGTGGTSAGLYYPAANTVAITTSGVNALTISSTQAATFTGSISSVNTFGYKNRLINGNMQIWQRATTATGNYSTVFTYNTVDRWATYSGNNSTTISQNTSVPTGFQYSVKVQRPNGNTGTAVIQICQGIESTNCYDLSGQSVTLSFWAKKGANYSGSTLNAIVTTGTTADQGIGTIGSWAGVATPISQGATLSTTWTKYSYTGTFGAGVLETGVTFSWTGSGTAGADDAVYITGVQLEVGSQATSFDFRDYQTEFVRCQRYFRFVSYGTYGTYGRAVSSTAIAYFPTYTNMRTSPTAGLTSGSMISDNGSASATAASPTVDTSALNVDGSRLFILGFSGLTTGDSWPCAVVNRLFLSAEL